MPLAQRDAPALPSHGRRRTSFRRHMCAATGAPRSQRDKHALSRSLDATSLPSHSRGGPAPGGTCVCHHRHVTIAARQARPVPLAQCSGTGVSPPPPFCLSAFGPTRRGGLAGRLFSSRSPAGATGGPGPGPADPPGRPPFQSHALACPCDPEAACFPPTPPGGPPSLLLLWPSAQAYALRCSLPYRLASSRRG